MHNGRYYLTCTKSQIRLPYALKAYTCGHERIIRGFRWLDLSRDLRNKLGSGCVLVLNYPRGLDNPFERPNAAQESMGFSIPSLRAIPFR